MAANLFVGRRATHATALSMNSTPPPVTGDAHEEYNMRESAQNPNTAVLAQLITEAFMDQRELRRLCRDSHEFRPVLELVSEASSLRVL